VAAAGAIFANRSCSSSQPPAASSDALQIYRLAIAVGRYTHVSDHYMQKLIGFRALSHSDSVCRAGFEAEIRRSTRKRQLMAAQAASVAI
jgi:hypothetical protein